MDVFYDYLTTITCSENARSNYPHAGDQVQEGQGIVNVALFGQQLAEKEKKKRDLMDIMCYGCGKKENLRPSCPTPMKGAREGEEREGEEREGGNAEKAAMQSKASNSKAKATTVKKRP